jgi:lipid A 4'-phosphatase
MNKKKLFFTSRVLVFLAVFFLYSFYSAEIDLAASRFFYEPQQQFANRPVFEFAYHFGFWPVWIVIILAAFALIGSFFTSALKKYRQPSLFLILTLALGSGFIIHFLLKDHWGRPRPKQVIEFGGTQPFRPYYAPNFFHQTEKSKSFPSGHASVGFYFFTFIFLGKYYRKKILYYTGVFLTIGLGSWLGLARLAQGGHFLSDILFSALIMWLTAFTLYRYLLSHQYKECQDEGFNAKAA